MADYRKRGELEGFLEYHLYTNTRRYGGQVSSRFFYKIFRIHIGYDFLSIPNIFVYRDS